MFQHNRTEIGQIFRDYGPLYRTKNRGHIPLQHLKVMNAIELCRTPDLGCNVYKCEHCDELHFVYESCGNRHCPRCQSLKAIRWISEKKKDLLPVQYFHLVFTIPAQLNPIAIRNQKTVYTILFDSVSQTLQELSKDKKHIGADIGFFSILHTWGQNLMDHPHIHCVATGGGLNSDKSEWISTRKNFFIPVRIISKRFRSIFLQKLKDAQRSDELKYPGKINYLSNRICFQKLVDDLFEREWVVFSKRPFRRPETVLEYLSRYTYKVAISNSRILKVENGYVYFKYKDYSDNQKKKIMKLDVFEFIRRFLLHVLPERFMKIRYYGLLANVCRKNNISTCRKLLKPKDDNSENNEELLFQKNDFSCPSCNTGKLILFRVLSTKRRCRSP